MGKKEIMSVQTTEKIYKNKKWLYEQYWTLEKSTRQIAKEFNIGRDSIIYWMKKHNIPSRTQLESWKGKKHSKEEKKKMSEALKGKYVGENSWSWKGDKVGNRSLHYWVRKNKPKPEVCTICNEVKELELSNISGEYKRDINDYWYLCKKCHKLFDKINKTHKRGKKI